MDSNATNLTGSAHGVISDLRPTMAKAEIRKADDGDLQAQIGGCLDYARRVVGWNLDQLSHALKRDPRQVARWLRGDDRVQMDVVFGVEELRAPFVVALALLARCEVETTIRMRRRA